MERDVNNASESNGVFVGAISGRRPNLLIYAFADGHISTPATPAAPTLREWCRSLQGPHLVGLAAPEQTFSRGRARRHCILLFIFYLRRVFII